MRLSTHGTTQSVQPGPSDLVVPQPSMGGHPVFLQLLEPNSFGEKAVKVDHCGKFFADAPQVQQIFDLFG